MTTDRWIAVGIAVWLIAPLAALAIGWAAWGRSAGLMLAVFMPIFILPAVAVVVGAPVAIVILWRRNAS